jgi:hypothetical protein
MEAPSQDVNQHVASFQVFSTWKQEMWGKYTADLGILGMVNCFWAGSLVYDRSVASDLKISILPSRSIKTQQDTIHQTRVPPRYCWEGRAADRYDRGICMPFG